MKKAILLSILAIVLCLSSCNIVVNPSMTQPPEQTLTTVPPFYDEPIIDYASPTYKSLKEYEDDIYSRDDLPEWFVYYDQLKELGEFYECYFLPNYNSLVYNLIWNSHIITIAFDLEPEGYNMASTAPADPPPLEIFTDNPMVYKYTTNGKLRKIKWSYNYINIEIDLFTMLVDGEEVSTDFSTLPRDTNYVICRLLEKQTARDAYHEINQMIFGTTE